MFVQVARTRGTPNEFDKRHIFGKRFYLVWTFEFLFGSLRPIRSNRIRLVQTTMVRNKTERCPLAVNRTNYNHYRVHKQGGTVILLLPHYLVVCFVRMLGGRLRLRNSDSLQNGVKIIKKLNANTRLVK
jgi:hypothetical protein